MMARPRREFDITQLLQFPPHGRLIERDCKFRVEPLHQMVLSKQMHWLGPLPKQTGGQRGALVISRHEQANIR